MVKSSVLKLGKSQNEESLDAAVILAGIDWEPLGLLQQDFKEILGDAATKGSQRLMIEVGIDSEDDAFDLGSENAAAWAAEHAGELISDNGEEGALSQATRDWIREAIADAIENGQTREELSDTLEDDYAFSEDRADLIADTELRTADNNGYLQGAKSSGLDLVKHWIITDEDTCDECLGNADDGYIDLDDTFSSGDDAPQAHPNCRCALGVVPASEADDSDDSD